MKFTNIAQTTALTEILYQVAPMYHFNLDQFEKIKDAIKPQVEAFEKTHAYSYRYALEDFSYLAADRSVQRTRFGEMELIANFRNEDFSFEGRTIPARSVAVRSPGAGVSFVYCPAAPSADAASDQDIPSLIAELSAGEWETRERAAIVISKIGRPAKAAVPALIAALADKEWQVRAASAKALANMEGEAARAVNALTKALHDEEWQVRRPAAYALAAIGKKAKAAVPDLIKALGDEEWQVRRPAAWALGSIGKDARPAIPALKALLADPELQVRMTAETAMERVER